MKATNKYNEWVDIKPEHANALIKYLELCNIKHYVAPYEADAQLAYLYKQGIIDVVFTEDSDLLAFGCRKVWLKKL